jgi:cytochrome b pre-mRNA-processing protein 3
MVFTCSLCSIRFVKFVDFSKLSNSISIGPSGIFLRRQLARIMWVDLDLRAQQIIPGQTKPRRKQLEELRSEMNAFMIALDEGLVDDDTVLAAAIWRHFCHFQPTPLERLVTLVTYIRKNIKHLEQLPDENFLKNGYIYFLPLHSDTVDTKFVNQHYLDFKNKAQRALKK